MTIREAIREQAKTMKNRTPKEKFSYFWEYYGLKTIALVAALVTLIAFVVTMVTQKEYAFSGMFFGGEPTEAEAEYLNTFAQSAGIDLKKNQLAVKAAPDIRMDQLVSPEIYQYMETFTAMVASKSVDCFAANEDLFLYYAYMGYAVDLRTVLTPQELEALAPYLYYADNKLIELQENADGGYADAYSQRPVPTKPEEMEDPVPVGISLDAATAEFKEAYRFYGKNVIGLCASSEHMDNALAFLRRAVPADNLAR